MVSAGKLNFNKIHSVDVRRCFCVKGNNLERNLTPKEQRQKEKRQAVLTEFQYRNGFSIQEMNEEFERQKKANIAKLEHAETTQDVEQNSSNIIYNSAHYVLSYLIPAKKENQKIKI